MVHSPAFTSSSVYSLGFCRVPGFAFGRCASFKSFLPAVRRLRGTLLFRGLRPSSIQWFLFWLLDLTVQSSRPAFGGRLTFGVSPFIFPLYARSHLFQRSALFQRLSSLLGLQRLCSKRHQLSCLQRCAASVAQRFFLGFARLQGWALPFGLRV